mmetsp:Transcript_3620/g.8587  ORF Transcript_3620/g.8587 Transcript_3620/m.8587 type:complete len:239 (+) Transcript_3620:658-1374(+)
MKASLLGGVKAASESSLGPNRCCELKGVAWIQVVDGEIWIHGWPISTGVELLASSSDCKGRGLTVEAGPLGATFFLREVGPATTSENFGESTTLPMKAQRLLIEHPIRDAKRNSLAPAMLPSPWCRAASSVVTWIIQQRTGYPCIIGVCGAKGAGRNVYLRMLVNSIFFAQGEAALIDGDCVQPEFGTPGLVSLAVLKKPLLAPGSVHFNPTALEKAIAPLKSSFVGSSPKVSHFLFK